MKDSKVLLITAIETCERLYLERQVMESLLIGARVQQPDERHFVHQKFQPLYDLATREAGADKALEAALQALPKQREWN